ncbi:MAG: triose-phosphate isomerase [Deltaproteobacteria bacterium]|nr:MAG: triose-phosphate isomerase [Deltaproteobacteria bacterium]
MPHRTPLIAANWKMHKTAAEATADITALAARIQGIQDIDVLVAPPFTSISAALEAAASTRIAIGGQNLYWEEKGAFTGEISASMLAEIGCRYVLVGHSERRQFFGETDERVCKKIAAAFQHGLIPVLCIGETEKERDAEKTVSVLDNQLKNGLKGFDSSALETLVIAYEPVWAIGTGKTATPAMVQDVHAFIRTFLTRQYGEQLAGRIRILYGGSVKPANIGDLMALPDVDGALVGGASLNPASFADIVKFKK